MPFIPTWRVELSTKRRILLSLMTEENDFQLEQAASARRAAEGLQLDLQILFAGNDTITQSTQILRAIQGDAALRPTPSFLNPWAVRPFRRLRGPPAARASAGAC
jgi:hypothetical protein